MSLPNHLFVSSTDGGLYDTRVPHWHMGKSLRKNYQYAHRQIKTTAELKATMRVKYAWPGSYEIVYVTSDGALLCHDCVIKHLRSVLDSIRNKHSDGWKIEGCMIEAVSADCAREVSEDLISHCDQCNKEFGEFAG